MGNNERTFAESTTNYFQIAHPEFIQTGCDECNMPFALYGFEPVESTLWNSDKPVTKFFCELHYLEFREAAKQQTKISTEQKQENLARFTLDAEVSR